MNKCKICEHNIEFNNVIYILQQNMYEFMPCCIEKITCH